MALKKLEILLLGVEEIVNLLVVDLEVGNLELDGNLFVLVGNGFQVLESQWNDAWGLLVA